MMKIIIIPAIFVLISAVSANNFFQNVSIYADQFTRNIYDGSNQCANDYKEALSNNTIFWKMLDASAFPIGNGFIYSTGLNLGSYDECLEINHNYISENTSHLLRGKFCAPLLALPYEILELIGMPLDELAPDLRDEYILLSGCIPDSCGANELRQILNNDILNISEIIVDELLDMCVNVDGEEVSTTDIVVITIFCFILFLVVISTVYDVIVAITERTVIHPILVAFSAYSNGKKLLAISPKTNKEQIHVFNGLKFISMMWIIAGHAMEVFDYEFIPVLNRQEVYRWERVYRYSQYIYTAPIAVDTFFFISGFLLAYMYLKPKITQKPWTQIKSIPYMYIHRYLRLTPAYLMVFLLFISILKHIGDGGLFHLLDTQAETCKTYWWSVFLYIQNYYNYDDMCLIHTWYLSADMQLFLLSPLIIIPISLYVHKRYKLVMLSLAVLNIIFVVLPLIIKLTFTDYTNEFDMHSRLCDYSFGITLAVYMRINKDKPYPFSKKLNSILWIVTFALMIAIYFGYGEINLNGTDTATNIFDSFKRPLWCICLSWIIFSSHNGHGGVVNWILTRSIFQVGSKVSYCMYLLHMVVLAYYALSLRTRLYFSDYNAYYLWCGHFITTFVLSCIWTLAFESPMIIIEKYIFGGLAPKKKDESKLKTDENVQ